MRTQSLLLALLFITTLVVTIRANSVSTRALNKAISEILLDKTSEWGFEKMFEKWFGSADSMFPDAVCAELEWPDKKELEQYATWQNIFNRGFIMYGANSVANIPKRFNYTSVNTNPEYGTVIGWEADIASAITYRINQEYKLTLKSYFSVSPWNPSPTNNIIVNLYKNQYDFIVSGMSFNNTWPNPQYNSSDPSTGPQNVPRGELVDFSCTYQDGGYGVVKGNLPLPENVTIVSSSDIDQVGVVVCVQASTTMQSVANANLKKATIMLFDNAKEKTLAQDTCHMYIAPIINAAYDGKNLPEATFIGGIGSHDLVVSEAVAVAARKEVLPTQSSSSDSTTVRAFIMLQIVIALIAVLI